MWDGQRPGRVGSNEGRAAASSLPEARCGASGLRLDERGKADTLG